LWVADTTYVATWAGCVYDALAESIIGLFKTEVIRARGPSRTLDAVEYATLEWVDWFNDRRLLESIGYVPPAEYEQTYCRLNESRAMAARPNPGALRDSRDDSVAVVSPPSLHHHARLQ
jgi:hypothetical protein